MDETTPPIPAYAPPADPAVVPAAPSAPDLADSGLISTLVHIWPLLLVLAAWIGIMYGWKRLRAYNAQRGKATPPLGQVVRPLLKFMFREDRRPVFTKPKALAERSAGLTGSRFYLLLLALIPISKVTGLLPWPIVLLVLLLTVWGRYAPISRARRSVLMQMFAVAAAECRYPRGAELNPWGYVQIQKWNNLTQPGETVVTYPAAYQSEEQRTREKFERQFNGTISDENTWNYKWESSKNRVVCRPTDFLPTRAPYPGPGPKWDEFHLGVGAEGPVTWNVSVAPHILVCGPTGSGKSVLQRMILFHALVHSDTWKIVGVDPKMVEMGWLKKYDNVLKIALDLEEGVEIVQSVKDEMKRRFEEMTENGVNHFQLLPSPPPALMLMVDETYNFLAPEGVKSDEGKERDDLHARGSVLIGEIARLGRAAGVHLVLATQRPDATVLKGELKNNLDARIAAGRMDTTPSLMVLDDEGATRLPKVKGRGLLRVGGEMDEFQGYFAEQDWFDQYVEAMKSGAMGPDGPQGDEVPEPQAAPAPQAKTKTQASGGVLSRVKAAAASKRAAVEAREAADAAAQMMVAPAPVTDGDPEPAIDEATSDDRNPEALREQPQAAVRGGAESVDEDWDMPEAPDEDPDEDWDDGDPGWGEEEVAAAVAEVIATPAPPKPSGGLPVGLPSARPTAPTGGGLPTAPRPGKTGGLPFVPTPAASAVARVVPPPPPPSVPRVVSPPPVPPAAPAPPAPTPPVPPQPVPAPAPVESDDPFALPGGVPQPPKPTTAPGGLPSPLGRRGVPPRSAPASGPPAAPSTGLPTARPGLPVTPADGD